jgi:homocysteine S-methyltransferase
VAGQRGLGARLGFTRETLKDVNLKAVRLLEEVRGVRTGGMSARPRTEVVISRCLGPRRAATPGLAMSEREAEAYHREQIETFAGAAADTIGA